MIDLHLHMPLLRLAYNLPAPQVRYHILLPPLHFYKLCMTIAYRGRLGFFIGVPFFRFFVYTFLHARQCAFCMLCAVLLIWALL